MTHLKIVNIRKYASLTDLKILVNTPESSFTEGINLICVKLPKPKKTEQKIFCSSFSVQASFTHPVISAGSHDTQRIPKQFMVRH